jgi:hypothetical protein
MLHRSRRVLPIAGDVLVKVGQTVGPRDIVARTYMPGDVTPLNLANLLSMPPADVRECMLKKEGSRTPASAKTLLKTPSSWYSYMPGFAAFIIA